MSEDRSHIVEPKTYYAVFAALMLLLVLTVLAAKIPNPLLNILGMVSIATTKAVLIVLYFMHVRMATPLTRIVSVTGFAWLLILLGLLLSDVTTRRWDRSSGSEAGPADVVEPQG